MYIQLCAAPSCSAVVPEMYIVVEERQRASDGANNRASDGRSSGRHGGRSTKAARGRYERTIDGRARERTEDRRVTDGANYILNTVVYIYKQ